MPRINKILLKDEIFQIIDILNISKSLAELKKEINNKVDGCVLKIVALRLDENYKIISSNVETPTIFYIPDGFNIGSGSILKIKENLQLPLLFHNDYEIIKQTDYVQNNNLIDNLLINVAAKHKK